MVSKRKSSPDTTRFDLSLLHDLDNSDNAKATYDYIRNNWRKDEQYKTLGLNSIQSNVEYKSETEDKAARSCLDFHFERFFVPTMGDIQADGYFTNITQSMNFQDLKQIKASGPLLIECIHHQSIFSILYFMITQLNKEFGYNKVFMMHQKEEPDPRLLCEQRLFKNLYNIELKLYEFKKMQSWYKSFKSAVNDKSIIIYFGDLAPKAFPEESKNSTPKSMRLTSSTNKTVQKVKRLSIAEKMSENVGANHYFCNIDQDQNVSLKPIHEQELSCPIESWVFWPGLGNLYES